MRKALILLVLAGCAPKPYVMQPRPVVYIEKARPCECPPPEWEEAPPKWTPERAAQEMKTMTMSVMDYVQVNWCEP